MATAFKPAGWTEMKSRLQIYVALEDLDFTWCERREIPVVGRDPDEVAILIMDRVRKRLLRSRPGGVFGEEWRK